MRSLKGMTDRAPPFCWARKVIMLDMMVRMNKGTFSRTEFGIQKTFEWPVIEKNQNKWQRNEHRLGHKAEDKENEGDEVTNC
jgi:hypothetical protein